MMARRRKAKPKTTPKPKRKRRTTAAWAAAGFAPVAIALSAAGGPGFTGATTTGSPFVPPAGSYVEATAAIPRLTLSRPEEEVLESWEKSAANKTTFQGCGPSGTTGSDKETNLRKNRTDLPAAYHVVAFDAIANLDWPHDAKTRRDKWTKEQLAEIAPYEGIAVTVTGFVVALRPQKSNSETTNCGEHGEELTDWHIALVGESDDKEKDAVVVETTPRVKRFHPNWTPDALTPFVNTKDSVRVSGYLFFDPSHKNHLGKYRQTLWEVHPIHRIEVFENGKWVDLDAK